MIRNSCIRLLFAVALAPVALHAQVPVGELFAGQAAVRGSVVLAAGGGTSVLSGSQVSAGESAAVLKLQRGGELRICPRTSLSVNTSPQGNELLIGFNTGSLELHYKLAAGTDTVITPDFRIQMIGPGTFDVALSADQSGATCVRPLEGTDAGIIVTEVMGSGSYQVAPDSAVTFIEGRISSASKTKAPDCGCPAPKTPVVQAAAPVTPQLPPPPPQEPKLPPELHLQVDTPMVYHGDSANPVYSASRLSTKTAPSEPQEQKPEEPKAASASEIVAAELAAPPAPNKPTEEKRGFMRRIGHFFSRAFGGG